MPRTAKSKRCKVDPSAQPRSTQGNNLRLVDAKKLTVKQAAQTAGIAESTMRQEIKQGRLPVIRVGTKMTVLERDLEVYLRRHYGHIEQEVISLVPASRLPKEISESDLINPRRKSA